MKKRLKVVTALAASSFACIAPKAYGDYFEIPREVIEGQSLCTTNPWLTQCGGEGVSGQGEPYDLEAEGVLLSTVVNSAGKVKDMANGYQPSCQKAWEPDAVYIQRQIQECKSWVLEQVGKPLNLFSPITAAALAGCQTHTPKFADIAMNRSNICSN